MKFNCRHCNNILSHELIDLGSQPPSNNYLTEEELKNTEKTYPLQTFICEKCWLVQIPEYAKPEELFKSNYAYFSSTSSSWCNHANDFVEKCLTEKIIDKDSFVVEIASNDGYLLQYVQKKGINCLGIEPTADTSEAAARKGIKTIREFFGEDIAKKLKEQNENFKKLPNLIIANNVIAHVPDINDFMKGLSQLIDSNGIISIEFPHLLNLIQKNQFDTIYHEHYSYLSLKVIKRIADYSGLEIINVEELTTHGGSLRVWLKKKVSIEKNLISKNVSIILRKEEKFNLEKLSTYKDFHQNIDLIRNNIFRFLDDCSLKNKIVGGYGAAAKANTLLNFLNLNNRHVKFVADKSKSKQNKFLPGSRIPISSPDKIAYYKPDIIIIFPWNIAYEIKSSLKEYELYVLLPKLKKIN